MHFLQNSPVHIHGNLKSSNVLIDSRWTCKLTDHGLFLFKEGQEVDVEAGTEAKYYGTLCFLQSSVLFTEEYYFCLANHTSVSRGWQDRGRL